MKKTLYYNFLPSKKEEMVAMATNRQHQVTRTLIEIRDNSWEHQQQQEEPSMIWKTLETHEAMTGTIHLSHDDVFKHIFRYWSLEIANHIVTGNMVNVKVCDLTEDKIPPVMYGPWDEQVFFEKGLEDEYVLRLNMAMVRSRGFKEGDKVCICFDGQVFYVKVFRIG